MLDQARQADGDQEEEHDRKRQREHDRPRPQRAGYLILFFGLAGGQLRVRRHLQRAKADRERAAERHHPAHNRQAQGAVTLQRRAQRVGLHLDLAAEGIAAWDALVPFGDRVPWGALVPFGLLGDGLAHGDGPVADAAHHHALEHRLAAERSVALRLQLARGLGAGRRGSRRPLNRSRRVHGLLAGSALRCVQAALGDASLEALDASTGVHELLAPGVEGVAVRAHLDAQLVARGARHEFVPAGAVHARGHVARVDAVLHRGPF